MRGKPTHDLCETLRKLNLTTMVEHYETLAREAARDQLPHVDYLARLADKRFAEDRSFGDPGSFRDDEVFSDHARADDRGGFGAAQDGAATGAAVESSPAAGLAVTDQLVTSTVGGLINSYSSSVSSNGADITVRVQANATKVFPLFPTITMTASSSATIERFRPQGS